MACDLREGHQAGLTTVEVRGAFHGVNSVRMKLLRREPKEVVQDRTLAAITGGRISIRVPAYQLPDGDYVIQIATAEVPRLLAVGTFRKASGEAPPVADEAHPAAIDVASLFGEWTGIKGTGGRLVLSAEGKYVINGGAGEYHVVGNQIEFTGPLVVWNGGRAKLKDGKIEFAWTNPQGAKRLYAFARTRQGPKDAAH